MMDSLRTWRSIGERVDALALRERALIFVALLVALYFLAANIVFAPLTTEQAQLRQQLSSARDQIQLQERQIQIIAGGDAGAPGSHQARVKELREQLRATDEVLTRATTGLVTPREMARLVEQMLAKNRRLVVNKVESLPPVPLMPGATPNGDLVPTAGATASPAAGVYKHGMRIELSGRYLDILAYLKALEDLPWKIFWAEATLQTDAHPTARLTLLIHTLSFREGWIAI